MRTTSCPAILAGCGTQYPVWRGDRHRAYMVDQHRQGRRITMTHTGTTALGGMTGARYIDSMKDGREIWLDGEKIRDVTAHPAFAGMVYELARLYDLQHTEAYRDQMTFISPDTGNRCSVS